MAEISVDEGSLERRTASLVVVVEVPEREATFTVGGEGVWWGMAGEVPFLHHRRTSLTFATTISLAFEESKARVCQRMLSSSRKVSV